MPHMNRIRVNNVKYNFGTQQYDDFVMRLHGKNTIYDLANGGGKSVLMLLLMQNMIPNCTLDEKQPIEKLFRTSGGSTTIHSLVEWNLDECDIKEDYRYMLTGFCARKAKDAADEENGERDTQAIEYFNYCIFYRTYNDNDLVNLPLVKDGERITYSGLKNYLKELDRNAPELKVYVFDRKGEYQQFISHYGLYESAWEIIRGINKTEGHVRTYFETNYKTTRKVVEDLLIEEIIEKSFRDKTDKADLNESMAKTLLDIKDKLMELSEKKNEMNRFEHQKELLRVLAGRVEKLQDLYGDKNSLTRELLCVYNMLKEKVTAEEDALLQLKRNIESKNEDCEDKRHVVACLKVQQDETQLVRQKKEEAQAQQAVQQAAEDVKKQEEKYHTCENANDYLEFLNMKKKCDEQESIVEKAKDNSGDYLDRLYDCASVKKQFLDERLQKTYAKAEEASNKEHELKVELKSMMNAKRELECEEAVAKAEKNRLAIVVRTKEEQLQKERKQTHLLILEDVAKELRQCEKQIRQMVHEQDTNRTKQKTIEEEIVQCRLAISTLQMKLENYEQSQGMTKQLEEQLRLGQERILAMLQAYLQLQPETSDESVYADETVLTQAFEKLMLELEKAMEEIGALAGRCDAAVMAKKALQEGHVLADTTLLEQMKQYLCERHELHVSLGQEFLLNCSEEEHSEILSRYPFAMYGLVIEDGDKLTLHTILQDTNLHFMAKDQMVPVFLKDSLFTAEFDLPETMTLVYGAYAIAEGDANNSARMDMVEREITKCQNEKEHLLDHKELLQQDLEFLNQYRIQVSLYKKESCKEADDEQVQSNTSLQDMLQTKQQYLQECVEQKNQLEQKMTDAESKIQETQQECGSLQQVQELLDSLMDAKQQMTATEEKEEELHQKLNEAGQTLETKNALLKEVREHRASYQKQIDEANEQWERDYKEYYKERPVLDLGYTEQQLDSEFMAMKAMVEKRMGSVQDKQALVNTLRHNMEQKLRVLNRRGANLENLQALAEEGELYLTSESQLDQYQKETLRYQNMLDEKKQQFYSIQKETGKCEGRIEHGLRQLEEQGISYHRLDMEEDDVNRALKEQQQVFAKLVQEKEDMTSNFITRQKQHGRQVDFYKDVKRVMQMYHLQEDETIVSDQVAEYTMEQLKNCQMAFEKVMAKEQRAKQDFEQHKQQTAQSLRELQAYELGEVIANDVIMPTSTQQLQELLDSLKDMEDFITLEQERVEQGIQDMELIRQSFENQCIRQCQDIKTELERLPRLSGITLDDENIQMISLTIPYVSEEQIPEKMAEYIDHIVKSVDKLDNYKDRMKYIRSQLSLKRLFSVIVTDMNAIRLNLYKRERVREQSRYLRYEEAVGSTGQSQGIYIQFLIAIINYIANIHSINSDNTDLGKVIFIDNPFGAAKDIYIWEPIFKMLSTNNVQLIVPARGATPAITGRFDVNYILGQKMVGGKQQTVVVDYRSQVEKTELEYKKIEFSQNSFDFI